MSPRAAAGRGSAFNRSAYERDLGAFLSQREEEFYQHGAGLRDELALGPIYERHRHRFEVNNRYRQTLEAAGLALSGQSPDGRLVEIVELRDHPWFVATQAHPELKSRPNRPHPLFREFVGAAAAGLAVDAPAVRATESTS